MVCMPQVLICLESVFFVVPQRVPAGMGRIFVGLLSCAGITTAASSPNRCMENMMGTNTLTSTDTSSIHHTCGHFIGVESMTFDMESYQVSSNGGCGWEGAYAGVNEGTLGTPLVVKSCSPDQNIHDWKVWDFFTEGLQEPYRVIASDNHWVSSGLNYAVKGNITMTVAGTTYDCGSMHYGQGHHDLWDYNGFFGGDSCEFHDSGKSLECCNGLLFEAAGYQNHNNRFRVSSLQFV
uniref:Uncharacterized protein n=1 Tax=Noctiluca scintillans TaxID=2966 RepID=A0A7S1AYS1_NOCSC|mmetsp:Transcript_65611/g.173754  ORF Transcript_65611/g.173754 Transcript_65611/m.173754 type:complete len:236 (+) Transcript_65611:2-709(+)